MGWPGADRCFHSEADFQFALSREIEMEMPDCEVRLERPFRSGGCSRRVDIWLPQEGVAVELKYDSLVKTRFEEVPAI